MRTTLSLEPDVYQAAKALAESSGRTMGQVVSELLRKAIRGTPEPPLDKEGAIPVFRVSERARIIPSNRAAELMAEEGVE
jgi:hypothetical protein